MLIDKEGSMKRFPPAITATLALTTLSLFTSCGRITSYSDLAEKPERSAAPPPLVTEESLISLNALFPYETITAALTAALPANIPIQGRQHICQNVEVKVQKTVEEKIGGDVGKLVGGVVRLITKIVTVGQAQNLCTDIDYHAQIKREGSVTVSQNGDMLRLSVPVRADGGAGFAGDLAKFLSLNDKSFRGSLTAMVDIRMDIDEKWCPSIQATPDFVWNDKAQLEVAGKFWIDIDSQAGDAIKKAMMDAAQKIPTLITCDQIKQLVQPLWHQYNVPLPSFAGQTGNVTLTPQRVGFSGLSFTPGGTQLALMLTTQTAINVKPLQPEELAKAPPTAASSAAPESQEKAKKTTPALSTAIGQPPAPSAVLALPKLERIPAEQNKLKLAVPITASFISLQDVARAAVVDKPIEGTSGDIEASVTPKEISVYPSGERLVIGVRFESKISKPKKLAPQGWVYLIAKPNFDIATQTLSLSEVNFSRIIDNDLWNSLSFLFQDRLRNEIEKAARIDLRPQIAEARKALRKELNTAATKEGINLDLKDDFIGLKQVAVTDAGVQIVVGFEGAANIVVLHRPTR